MSAISEQNSVSSQIDTILKNRYRRFRYLMRNDRIDDAMAIHKEISEQKMLRGLNRDCLLYTSPSPRDVEESRMPSSA